MGSVGAGRGRARSPHIRSPSCRDRCRCGQREAHREVRCLEGEGAASVRRILDPDPHVRITGGAGFAGTDEDHVVGGSRTERNRDRTDRKRVGVQAGSIARGRRVVVQRRPRLSGVLRRPDAAVRRACVDAQPTRAPTASPLTRPLTGGWNVDCPCATTDGPSGVQFTEPDGPGGVGGTSPIRRIRLAKRAASRRRRTADAVASPVSSGFPRASTRRAPSQSPRPFGSSTSLAPSARGQLYRR